MGVGENTAILVTAGGPAPGAPGYSESRCTDLHAFWKPGPQRSHTVTTTSKNNSETENNQRPNLKFMSLSPNLTPCFFLPQDSQAASKHKHRKRGARRH